MLIKLLKMNIKWEEAYSGRLLIMTYGDCKPRPKIAGFDMDGTLITTKSGKVFAVDKNDWRLLYEQQTVKQLERLHEDERFKIVIMTNQVTYLSISSYFQRNIFYLFF
jgi:bifunctional polynucleotide phosphatase/kinase